ncbi:lantibiotic dehydratase [Actinomadura sp. DC4]|uniref:lantibiotic dehydratase n=1 Tax=Actinomadura sp. DC4 TaxID=3055069 RepID=UPI0025B244CE|nr:lantibiotic dehydratase [Actinomadura sp. DC4]MDN3356281.1 lantibiotic dehydratase [Actinomadura sp. DC4]
MNADPNAAPGDHKVPLPGTEWHVWRDALIRSAGFPADGLDRFTAPECARVADAHLDGHATTDHLTAAHTAATEHAARQAEAIAADPLFREALTWQNPGAAATIDHLTRPPTPGKNPRRQRQKRRAREDVLARYWQRYCGKNDTIGFFGPVTWATIDPTAPAITTTSGPHLTRTRQVHYEYWLLHAYAAHLATDPAIRPWLPVRLRPHLTHDGDQVHRPDGPPHTLTAHQADTLTRCDGRPAAHAGDATVLHTLTEQAIITWGIDMPYNPRAEHTLRTAIAAIPDPHARDRAQSGLTRLDHARTAIANAAGDPGGLARALTRLDTEFTDLTGTAPERRAGQMYAGRRLCYEETVRDLDITIGGPILDALAGPLGRVLLPAARWLSATLTATYDTAFRALYTRLLPPGEKTVPLSRLWQPAQDLITGAERPADTVTAEFTRRWYELFGLDTTGLAAPRVTTTTEALAGRAARLYAAERPGWAAARIHSPDLHVCATDTDAINRGDFTIVLGEMHAAWPTLDCAIFADPHPDPERLRAAAATDIGPQFRPLYPTWWPRYTARIAPVLGVTDHQLAFTDAPGADPRRVLPVTALTVTDDEGTLTVTAPDGRTWPLSDVFALLTGWLAGETFKLTGSEPHTPRLTIDRLVVTRETWRTTIAATGLVPATGRIPEYLAARRLRRALDLPERVFAKLATEVKPVYLDLTSPRYVSAFTTMLRTAAADHGGDVPITLTELLPGPDQAWLPDAHGRRYCSELRLQFVDPRTP